MNAELNRMVFDVESAGTREALRGQTAEHRYDALRDANIALAEAIAVAIRTSRKMFRPDWGDVGDQAYYLERLTTIAAQLDLIAKDDE